MFPNNKYKSSGLFFSFALALINFPILIFLIDFYNSLKIFQDIVLLFEGVIILVILTLINYFYIIWVEDTKLRILNIILLPINITPGLTWFILFIFNNPKSGSVLSFSFIFWIIPILIPSLIISVILHYKSIIKKD